MAYKKGIIKGTRFTKTPKTDILYSARKPVLPSFERAGVYGEACGKIFYVHAKPDEQTQFSYFQTMYITS
jgi:hypothetical protein